MVVIFSKVCLIMWYGIKGGLFGEFKRVSVGDCGVIIM